MRFAAEVLVRQKAACDGVDVTARLAQTDLPLRPDAAELLWGGIATALVVLVVVVVVVLVSRSSRRDRDRELRDLAERAARAEAEADQLRERLAEARADLDRFQDAGRPTTLPPTAEP